MSAVSEAPSSPSRRRRLGRPRSWPHWLVPACAVATYFALAALAFWPVEPFSRSQVVGCACSDPAQEVWFLAWPAYAIRHGLNPFFTSFLEYPRGVNLASNTSMPLLGLLGAPLTWLRGPIATFNALMRLSFALSATSMLFVLRRFTRWWPSAFLGGLLYGYSPYMIGQAHGHLFLTFVPLPPLIALSAYELVRRAGEGRRWLAGLLLGGLCVLQFFISMEVLVTTLVCVVVVAVVAAIAHPRAAAGVLVACIAPVGAAAGVFLAVTAYPIWFFFRGPRYIVGPPHAIANIAPIKADLLGPVVPTHDQLVGTAHLMALGTGFSAGDLPENGVYLGITLLALLVVLVVAYRHERAVLLAAALCATGFVLALGTPLVVDRHVTGVPLPFDVLLHLPLVQGVASLRLSLYEQLGAAFVLGVGLDLVYRDLADGRGRHKARLGARAPVVAAGVALALAAAALVPLLPRLPFSSRPADMPAYFLTGEDAAIPPGSVVLTYPYDVDPFNEAMLWQAASGMRFRIFGGQATTPGPHGLATSDVVALEPATVQQLFDRAEFGRKAGPLPVLDAVTITALRTFLVRHSVGTVVVDLRATGRRRVLRDLTRALDRPPTAVGGVAVWYRADERAAALLGLDGR